MRRHYLMSGIIIFMSACSHIKSDPSGKASLYQNRNSGAQSEFITGKIYRIDEKKYRLRQVYFSALGEKCIKANELESKYQASFCERDDEWYAISSIE